MYFLTAFLSVVGCIPSVYAGFSSSSSSNVAIYWGQNSYGDSTGDLAQQRLSYYCANTGFDIIPLAFLIVIAEPELNFANAGNNCTAFADSNLFSCPQMEEDIAECQNTYGKTILLSVGGSTYTEGGFATSDDAVTAANNIWAIFGPVQSDSTALRPFGSSAVNGFDFDFESEVSNMAPFANELRSLMDAETASTGAEYYLTAAPQCPYPDVSDNPMLDGTVYFDAIWIQFYNNYCELTSFIDGDSTQPDFDFTTWQTWASTISLNPDVRVFLGVPGGPTAAGSGYEDGTALAEVISYCQGFESFGGVMAWDMSQVYANAGFLAEIDADLGNSGGGGGTSTRTTSSTTTTTTTPTATTFTTSTTTTTSSSTSTSTTSPGTVPEWDQCGGEGWTGGTVCIAPYVCTYYSVWYSQCEPA